MGFIGETWVEVPLFRYVYVKDKGRKIIYLAYVSLKQYINGGEVTENLTIDLMAQYSHLDVT